jgi:homocysteine S-methyltransferase|tara:strand:+ start:8328 stop:9227 length:900 start_codon:yes stop_codon:yes gene_type:complete
LRDFYILDSGLGTELRSRGFALSDFQNSTWSAQALIDDPQLILEIHKDNIEAGCTVITTSNYTATPLIWKAQEHDLDFIALTETALRLAEEAVKSGSNEDVLIAGCFPPINVSFRPDLTPSENELEDFYEALTAVYKGKVDLILCETMASIHEANIAAKIASIHFEKVWLSWTTRGLNPSLLPSQEGLEAAAIELSKYNLDCQLVNCGHADLSTESLKILKSCVPNIGIYANSSVNSMEKEQLKTFENLHDVHHHHAISITPIEYANFAKEWLALGSMVIGGCCSTSPEHIKAIAGLGA